MNSYATIYDSVRGGMICIGKITATLGAITTATTLAEEVEVKGVKTGDIVFVTPLSGITNGIVLQSASVTDDDEVTINIRNTTAGSLTPGETVFQILILKRQSAVDCDTDEDES